MKKLFKFLLIIIVNATFALGSLAQSNIVSQSFEGSGTWNYVEFPAPYTVYSPPSDIWGICGNTYVTTPVNPNGSSWFTYNNGDVVAPLLSGISSASEGSHYFGICDINNPYTVNVSWPADPGNLWHTITFDPVSLPGSGTFPIKLAFDYYTVGFDGTDYIGWEVIWDNGTTWNALTTTSNSNTNTWTTKEFNAPSGATSVRLRVAVKQNGGTDFGAFDNFRVFLDVGDLTPPSVNSINVVDDVTLLLTTSEEVVNATDISNYGGIGVTSATVNSTGDSITLNLSAPLLIGQYTDIYVSSLTDVASNVMINDTLTVVFNNADLSTGLTITELMYNDPGNYDNIAFIEFHNTSSSSIPLGGLRIDDAISFVFPEFDLQAGDFAILAKGSFSGSSPCNTYPSGCGFETFFGFAPTFEWWTGYLSTSGELISVVNTQGDLVVDLAYDDSWAGGVGDGDGYSIVRCDPLSDINVDTNWTPAITVAIPACGTCTAGLGIGTTTIYAHPMIGCPIVYNGCMDTLAINYDPLANVDDGSCFFANNVGCTDSIATNYDPVFTVDDGSCIYPVAPMVNLYFSEFAEGSSNNKYFEIFNPTSDTVDLSNYAYPSTSNAPSTVGVYEYWNTFASGAIILPNDVYVVAHPFSDPAILAEADGTHSYLSNGDDGYALVYGSEPSSPVGPSAGGYIILDFIGDWNGDPGSGWAVAGVSNATQNHTLVRKCDVVQGNTDWILSAGTDAVNSEWIVLPINDWSELGFFNPCSSINYGCMDATANNYDPNATIDDGSCTYTVLGCTDSTAINFDPLANVDDGSCIASVLGCTDPVATNFDPLSNVDDGTCSYTNTVLGCTDPLAFNYDPLANTDDGSCIAIVNGCTDPSAGNYDATA
ncbi:MAG: hypothetical protein HOD68_01065, partial [Flavobacteriales bacterium]|nr:hypothetical protein [Flavobacteriales bacterium]